MSLQERSNTPFQDFPDGQGPPLFLSSSFAQWGRVAPGQGAFMVLDGSPWGLYATGMTVSTVLIWILPAGGSDAARAAGGAYCFHAPGTALDPRAHTDALAALGHPSAFDLYVFLASRHEVDERHERFFTQRGVRHDRVFTYSGALLPQFGVSARGCVGEAR